MVAHAFLRGGDRESSLGHVITCHKKKKKRKEGRKNEFKALELEIWTKIIDLGIKIWHKEVLKSSPSVT